MEIKIGSKFIVAACTALAFFYASTAAACSLPHKGFNSSLQELVYFAGSIVLVEFDLENETIKDYKIIRVLKGEIPAEELSKFIGKSNRSKHNPNTFNHHRDPAFWDSELKLVSHIPMRSLWHGGSCYPSFTFMEGEQYLIFPDSLANPYAAEIIKSEDDAWLKYVLKLLDK